MSNKKKLGKLIASAGFFALASTSIVPTIASAHTATPTHFVTNAPDKVAVEVHDAKHDHKDADVNKADADSKSNADAHNSTNANNKADADSKSNADAHNNANANSNANANNKADANNKVDSRNDNAAKNE